MSEVTCYICSSDKFVDDHHYDCQGGKLSPETVLLCRRCHRTYHDLGVEWFEDEYLDKAIEVENKRREIVKSDYRGRALAPLKREDIKRSDYWYKKHGIKQPQVTAKGTKNNSSSSQPGAFSFVLPKGDPLCGWDWVNSHLHNLDGWVPRIEIFSSSFHLAVDIDSKEKLASVRKAIRGMKKGGDG